jgi:hypothetical protein
MQWQIVAVAITGTATCTQCAIEKRASVLSQSLAATQQQHTTTYLNYENDSALDGEASVLYALQFFKVKRILWQSTVSAASGEWSCSLQSLMPFTHSRERETNYHNIHYLLLVCIKNSASLREFYIECVIASRGNEHAELSK